MWAVLLGLTLLAGPPATSAALADKAETEYFAGDFAGAWVTLEDALAKDPEHSPVRPRIHLLRAAVKLKLGDQAAANEQADRALMIDPELSLADYPTDVRRLFEAALGRLPPRVVVQLTGMPRGAEARLDGRLVTGGVITAVPGTHRLTVRAAGFRPHDESLSITENRSIPVALVPDAAGTSRWRNRAITGSLFGASALSAAGGAWALDGLSTTRANKANAGPAQRSFYEKHERRFTQQAAAGLTIAAATAAAGTWRLYRASRPVAITVVPADGGGSVAVAWRFGGRSLGAAHRDAAVLTPRRGEDDVAGELPEAVLEDHAVSVPEEELLRSGGDRLRDERDAAELGSVGVDVDAHGLSER